MLFISAKSYVPSSTHHPVDRSLCSTLSILGHDSFDDYEKSREQFSLSVPEYFNFATDIIDRWACLEEVRNHVNTKTPCGLISGILQRNMQL